MYDDFAIVGRCIYTKYPITLIDGKYYVLNEDEWNGEHYFNCWRVKNKHGLRYKYSDKDSYTIAPVYRYEAEGIDLSNFSQDYLDEDEDGFFDIVAYKITI